MPVLKLSAKTKQINKNDFLHIIILLQNNEISAINHILHCFYSRFSAPLQGKSCPDRSFFCPLINSRQLDVAKPNIIK
jgi:hypothetical protein